MADKYIENIIKKFKTGKTTEHSFRGDLQEFVERTVIGIQAINEPTRQKCGAPDYIIQKKDIPIGYIEAKDIDKNLDIVEKSEQLDRYRASLNNLILTNYLEFRYFINGEKVYTTKIADIQNGNIKVNTKEFEKLVSLIRNFCDYQGQTIKSPKQLANLMAQKAVMIRDVIISSLEENAESSLVSQRNAFKQILLHDLTNHTFADMYAQTIAYGLFVARLNDTTLEDFSRQEARELVSKNNPFLRQLFDYISGANLDDSLIWIVDDLVDVFRAVDLNKLLHNYGRSTGMQDPFLHFYETFLESYDKVNKEKRGVYYTPLPVVRFIVRAVDDILKSEFNLAHGLADDTKVKYKRFLYMDTSNKKTKQAKEVWQEEEIYKVQILDPATGTGTFLAETIRKIYEYFVSQKGIWSRYVDEALIPRLNGFEIMMTPYVMCHLKLDLLLQDTGYTTTKQTNRFNVYLTNALEKDETNKYPLFDWLSEEARYASKIKSEKPIMVVLGNPPYSGESANGSLFSEELEVYKQEPTGGKLKEKNFKWINDDYVKFLRLAQKFVDKNNEGIVAFVNNHSFLDNPTFRGMRYSLLKSFDKIYVLNLHGNAKKKECCTDGSKDDNVFDIQQGVSINIFIKTQPDNKEPAKVYYKDLYGLRADKYAYMDNNNLDGVNFVKLTPVEPHYLFTPKDFSLQKEYYNGIKITELYPLNSVGIVTARDTFCIKNTSEDVYKTINDFIKLSPEEAREQYKLGKDVRDWKVELAQKDLSSSKLDFNNIVKISYRPFDTKYTYYTGKSKGFHCMPRNEVMQHYLSSNLGLNLCKQFKAFNDYHHVFVSKNIVESSLVSNKTSEITYSIPLYVYNNLNTEQTSFFDTNRKPNLNMDIVHELEQKLNLTFTPEKESIKDTFAPIDILDYVYGVLHSNTYRTKYKEFLKIDFPRIPYPKDKDYFFEIAELGRRIREIHLFESPALENLATSFPIDGDCEVVKLEYKDKKVYINPTQYFEGVSEIAWNFYIGGYQPAQKWLKDRKGRILGYDDIIHYQKIIVALEETNRLMQELDGIVEV